MGDKEKTRLSLDRLARARILAGELSVIKGDHECSISYCNPMNEPMMIQRGMLEGEPLTTDVYLCKHSVVHVCRENECTNTVNGTCVITGKCFGPLWTGESTYDSSDYRTWRNKTNDVSVFLGPRPIHGLPEGPLVVPTHKRRKRVQKKVNINQITEDVIRTLLYADRYRLAVNQARLKKSPEISNYIDMCRSRKIPINLIDVQLLQRMFKYRAFKMLSMCEYDFDLVNSYKNTCQQICSMVDRYWANKEVKICFKNVIIAFLYQSRSGYTVGENEILPRDHFLQRALPMANELPFFGFEKKSIVKGQRLLLDALQHTEGFKLDYIVQTVNEKADVLIRATTQKTKTKI